MARAEDFRVSRRGFIRGAAGVAGTLALAACGVESDPAAHEFIFPANTDVYSEVKKRFADVKPEDVFLRPDLRQQIATNDYQVWSTNSAEISYGSKPVTSLFDGQQYAILTLLLGQQATEEMSTGTWKGYLVLEDRENPDILEVDNVRVNTAENIIDNSDLVPSENKEDMTIQVTFRDPNRRGQEDMYKGFSQLQSHLYIEQFDENNQPIKDSRKVIEVHNPTH